MISSITLCKKKILTDILIRFGFIIYIQEWKIRLLFQKLTHKSMNTPATDVLYLETDKFVHPYILIFLFIIFIFSVVALFFVSASHIWFLLCLDHY